MRQIARQPQMVGIVLVAVVLITFVALFQKDKIDSRLMAGETITAHFPKAHKLRSDVSVVKVAYVPVGKVAGVTRTADGGADVEMKIDQETLAVLGSAPSATIRPTTVLGGSYFVDLQPGGDRGAFAAGSVIPAERTAVPVELDKVVGALQPDALTGLQQDLNRLDGTLDQTGQRSLQRLVAAAPDTLRPGGRVLNSALGHKPTTDLASVVSGLESTARVLTAREGQLDGIVVDAHQTAKVVAARRSEVGSALDVLPSSLTSARKGLGALNASLETLGDVSGDLRPVARELDRTLARLGPVVHDARPTIRDLRAAVHDATPVLADLVPVSRAATTIVGDLNGPVMDRVNGPVLTWLNAEYNGTGWYRQTHSDEPMYREVVGALVGLTRASARTDGNGHAIGLQPGVGAGSIAGLPLSLEQMYSVLGAWNTRSADGEVPAITSGLTVDQLLDSLKGGR